jgi:FkbM family methyltransferase
MKNYKLLKKKLRSLLSRKVKSHRILSGFLRGRRIVTSWHDYPAAIAGYTERPLLEWFITNVKPGETWLDVGAHYGYTSIALSRLVGDHGRVFSFEPMLTTAGYLEETRSLNKLTQLTILPLALGTVSTCSMIQVLGDRGMADHTIEHPQNSAEKAAWHYTILVARLDWLWPQICGDHSKVDGIKIDVQGMELGVLQGMVELLKRCKPKLVLEFHQNVDRKEILGLLQALGYPGNCSVAIEPASGEDSPQYLDNKSYAFQAV